MNGYVVRKEEIEEMEGTHKTHFLNPEAKRINKSLGDLTGLTGLGFHIIEVPPGHESTELHVHHYEEECLYVLEGKAKATVGETGFEINPGDYVGYRASGKAHKLENIGDSVLKCIVVGQRLSHDVADYPRAQKRLYRNNGMVWDMVDHDDLKHPRGGSK